MSKVIIMGNGDCKEAIAHLVKRGVTDIIVLKGDEITNDAFKSVTMPIIPLPDLQALGLDLKPLPLESKNYINGKKLPRKKHRK